MPAPTRLKVPSLAKHYVLRLYNFYWGYIILPGDIVFTTKTVMIPSMLATSLMKIHISEYRAPSRALNRAVGILEMCGTLLASGPAEPF